ncbi:hypothetical protein CRE_25833 [Caenorhabditis remanei]|uniref:Uncharacterized protein n=1 Tax=Caenorhabditis remanei TaxID=31234 RepID=E3NA84_CAERE|nr:hypothetical protein CRE_25833 [Caenorhabditis remanei]
MGDYSDDSQNVPPQNEVDNGFPIIKASTHNEELLPKTNLSTTSTLPEDMEYQGKPPARIPLVAFLDTPHFLYNIFVVISNYFTIAFDFSE